MERTNVKSPAGQKTGFQKIKDQHIPAQLATPTDLKPEEVQAVTQAVNPLKGLMYWLSACDGLVGQPSAASGTSAGSRPSRMTMMSLFLQEKWFSDC